MPVEVVGLDTNILCYALDPAFLEHKNSSSILKKISPEFKIAINPTVIHETYHTLVCKQNWLREEASHRLFSVINQRNVIFYNQTKLTSRNAMLLANKYRLGGRDSLILSNYLFNNVGLVYTHDSTILKLESILIGAREVRLADPLLSP